MKFAAFVKCHLVLFLAILAMNGGEVFAGGEKTCGDGKPAPVDDETGTVKPCPPERQKPAAAPAGAPGSKDEKGDAAVKGDAPAENPANRAEGDQSPYPDGTINVNDQIIPIREADIQTTEQRVKSWVERTDDYQAGVRHNNGNQEGSENDNSFAELPSGKIRDGQGQLERQGVVFQKIVGTDGRAGIAVFAWDIDNPAYAKVLYDAAIQQAQPPRSATLAGQRGEEKSAPGGSASSSNGAITLNNNSNSNNNISPYNAPQFKSDGPTNPFSDLSKGEKVLRKTASIANDAEKNGKSASDVFMEGVAVGKTLNQSGASSKQNPPREIGGVSGETFFPDVGPGEKGTGSKNPDPNAGRIGKGTVDTYGGPHSNGSKDEPRSQWWWKVLFAVLGVALLGIFLFRKKKKRLAHGKFNGAAKKQSEPVILYDSRRSGAGKRRQDNSQTHMPGRPQIPVKVERRADRAPEKTWFSEFFGRKS